MRAQNNTYGNFIACTYFYIEMAKIWKFKLLDRKMENERKARNDIIPLQEVFLDRKTHDCQARTKIRLDNSESIIQTGANRET